MSTRPFYAVKMRSGLVMVFEWSATEIAEAMMNKGVIGVIRCIEAEGSIPAEDEAKRLFAAGQFDPTAIVLPHIRIITRRAGRRINDARGASHTLCGGPMTDRDMIPSDARKSIPAGWKICPECVRLLDLPKTSARREDFGNQGPDEFANTRP